jgi:integrase
VLDSAVVHKQFMATMKRAGISGHTLYDLRHSFASRHLELGSPLAYVAAQLGHSKPTMTLKYYSHLLPRADKSFADRLDSAAARPAGEGVVSAA